MLLVLAWLLWGGLGVLLLFDTFKLLPVLVLFVWPARVRSTFDDAMLSTIFNGEDSALDRLVEDFKVLGFSPIGLKLERMPLWGPTFREVSLVSESSRAYASIILHPDSSPASKYCYTPFKDGGMVFTRDFAAGQEAESERLSVKNLPEASVADLVGSHLQRVDLLCGRGMTPSVNGSREARIAATTSFYSSEYARRSQRRVWWPRIRRWAILWGVFWVFAVLILLSPPSP